MSIAQKLYAGAVAVPYMDQLVAIRARLERVPGYPVRKCRIAAGVVEEILGLELVGGIYLPAGVRGRGHSFNYDAERGLYVDLSGDQFQGGSRIAVVPTSSGLLERTEEHTQAARHIVMPWTQEAIDTIVRELTL